MQNTVATTVENIISHWVVAMDLVWKYDPKLTVQERFNSLGANGVATFIYNSNLVTFLLTNIGDSRPDLTAIIYQKLQMVKPVEYNPDGSVTVLEEPMPS